MFKCSILRSAPVKILRQGWVKLSVAVKNFISLSFRVLLRLSFLRLHVSAVKRR